VCKRAENAAQHQKNADSRKIGGISNASVFGLGVRDIWFTFAGTWQAAHKTWAQKQKEKGVRGQETSGDARLGNKSKLHKVRPGEDKSEEETNADRVHALAGEGLGGFGVAKNGLLEGGCADASLAGALH